jgi:hypothetical protein
MATLDDIAASQQRLEAQMGSLTTMVLSLIGRIDDSHRRIDGALARMDETLRLIVDHSTNLRTHHEH